MKGQCFPLAGKGAAMIKPGICSITFRDKSPEEVIELCIATGLKGIEWGADIHVPSSNLENARHVGELTRAAGLEVAGYGSYWFARDEQTQPGPFEPILDAAVALGAPLIRIWGGSLSIEKTPAYFQTVVECSRKAAERIRSQPVRLGTHSLARLARLARIPSEPLLPPRRTLSGLLLPERIPSEVEAAALIPSAAKSRVPKTLLSVITFNNG